MASSEHTYSYAPDRFDHEADTKGAHGAHREDEPFWKQNLTSIVLVLAAVLALVVAVVIVQNLSDTGTTTQPSPAPSAPASSAPAASDDGGQPAPAQESESPSPEQTTPAPEPDKSRPVLVLNGTRINGLAGQWKTFLEGQGWQQVQVDTGQRTDTAGVYYKKDEDQATAAELAKAVGVGEPQKSEDYKADITVVVIERPEQ